MTHQRISVLAVVGVVAAILTTTASAAITVPWTAANMKTAIHAIGYPKPRPKTLSCKGQSPTTSGMFASFRCVAAYKHHHRSTFYIQGQGEGGWLCAGKTLAGCRLLKHGFLTTGVVKIQGLDPSIDITARGYMGDKYGSYQAQGFCAQKAAMTWACPFVGVTLTVTLKHAKGGYVTSAAAS